MAKVEWHRNELYPRVGFIVTNLARPAERVVTFYNQRGTCEQHIKEGKNAIKWTRLSCRTFAANAVRLQLHALAYNVWPAPSASCVLRECLISLHQRIRSRGVAPAKMEIRASRSL